MELALALASLVGKIITDAMSAKGEAAESDMTKRLQNLESEWTRKSAADADFDSRFDNPGT